MRDVAVVGSESYALALFQPGQLTDNSDPTASKLISPAHSRVLILSSQPHTAAKHVLLQQDYHHNGGSQRLEKQHYRNMRAPASA
ncbi:hypothetical protein A5657_02075 [Mycobacterium kubicae]|nr:hypothetical protein A5657_02075 [Mycobacterium kubicae]